MTREEILKIVKKIKNNNILLTLPTGLGKTRVAIEKVKSVSKPGQTLLIVVPRNVLKVNWKDELNKWWPECKLKITYTTYMSFPKYAGTWDIIIYDEAHHLSERCREALTGFNANYSILLSATVKRDLKNEFKTVFKGLYHLNTTLRDAIDSNILPDPTVYLLPLTLDNKFPNERIIKNPKAKGKVIYSSWKERWQYMRVKDNPVHIFCTQAQYVEDLNSQIEWFKKKYFAGRNEAIKNRWLKLCGDRLKYLSTIKTVTVLEILKYCNKARTLTFCNGIEQTEMLGRYCINSKNKQSAGHLTLFNNGRINHITACNMLNEGVNLINCQVGIYANLNSSETIVKQRTGRLLRHPNPIIIIPYYKGTREEELINKMLEDYNPSLIKRINFIKEIQL